MAHLFKKLVIVCGIFVLTAALGFAQGREITLFFKDGKKRNGEILMVRDSMVVILTAEVENRDDIVRHPELIEFAHLKTIDSILLHELEVKGALIGALAGTGVGFTLTVGNLDNVSSNLPSRHFGEIFGGMAVGAIAGLIAGWVFSTIKSEEEEIIDASTNNLLKEMKSYSRFSKKEPVPIRDFIDNLLKERQ